MCKYWSIFDLADFFLVDIPTFINSIEIDIDETDPLADVYQAVKEYFDSLLDEICNKTYIGMKRIQYPKDQRKHFDYLCTNI